MNARKRCKLICFFCFWFFCAKPIYSTQLSDLPDWFFNPSPGNSVGIIGIAFNQTIDQSISPLEFAKINAFHSLKKLFPAFQFNKSTKFKFIENKIKRLNFADYTITFQDSFTTKNYTLVHLLVQSKDHAADERTTKVCQPEICFPRWLCNPVTPEFVGFLGLSYESINLKDRLYYAQKNAMKVMEYSLGVKVVGEQSFSDYKNSIGEVTIKTEHYSVTKLKDNERLVFFTKAQCYRDNTLFTWQVSNDIEYFESARDLTWLSNPQDKNIDGVIGYASKGYDALFSRQFDRAIKHGINELSKNTKINIKNYTQNDNKNFVEKNLITHDNSIHPRLHGIYLDKKNRFFAWMSLFKTDKLQ